MERYIMFLDWKGQYCENDYTTQCNLQIQYNPYQTTNSVFHRTEQKNSQFVWKCKILQVAKEILKKKHGARGIKPPDFKLYYSYSHPGSMVLAQKVEILTSGTRQRAQNKPTQLWATYL